MHSSAEWFFQFRRQIQQNWCLQFLQVICMHPLFFSILTWHWGHGLEFFSIQSKFIKSSFSPPPITPVLHFAKWSQLNGLWATSRHYLRINVISECLVINLLSYKNTAHRYSEYSQESCDSFSSLIVVWYYHILCLDTTITNQI